MSLSFCSFLTRIPTRLRAVRWVSNAPKRRSGNRAARLGLAQLLREKKRWRASYEQFERVATDSVGLSKPAPPTPRQDVTVMEPYIRDISNFVHLHERVGSERGPRPPRFWTSFYRTPEPKPASDPTPSSAHVMAAPFVREDDQGQDEDDAEGEGDGSTPPPLARYPEPESSRLPLARPSWAHERAGWEQGPLPPWFTNSLHHTPEPASDPNPSSGMAAPFVREDDHDAEGEEDGHTPLPPPRYSAERPTSWARPSWARAIDDHDHPPPRQYFTQFTSLYRPSWASAPMPTLPVPVLEPPSWHFRPSLSSDLPPPEPPERPRDKEKRRKLHRRELLDQYLKKREFLPVMGYGLPTFKTGPSASPHIPAWHPPLPPSKLVLEKLNAILEHLGPAKTIPSKKRVGELMSGAKLELEILYYSERFTLAHLPPLGSGWAPLSLAGRFCEAILKARASGSGKRRLWIWNTRMLLMRLEELGGRMTPELEAVVGGLCREIGILESEVWEGIFGYETVAAAVSEVIFVDDMGVATLSGSEVYTAP